MGTWCKADFGLGGCVREYHSCSERVNLLPDFEGENVEFSTNTLQICISAKDAATQLGISDHDLIQLGALGKIAIGVRDYQESHLSPAPIGLGVERPRFTDDPAQYPFAGVLTLENEDLARLGQQNEINVSVGCLIWIGGKHRVMFSPDLTVSLDNLVVPISEMTRLCNGVGNNNQIMDTPVGETRKETYLIQIASLALLVVKNAKNPKQYMNGKKINKKAIGDAVVANIQAITKQDFDKFNLSQGASSNIRQNISKGLDLIGFDTFEDDKAT